MKEYFLGIPADVVTLEKAVSRVAAMPKETAPHFIASVNPEICISAAQNPALREVLSKADLGIPDGIGIVLASRLRGGKIKNRVAGIDLMNALVSHAAKSGEKIFLLGAAEGVAAAAAENLQKKYPGLVIAGTHHGYVPPEEEARVADKIAASGADIVFVGLGSPRQEFFVSRHGQRTKARVLMVVGGAFDVISGRLKRAPLIYQRLGLEWLYRVLQEPKRFKRILALPRFLLAVCFTRERQPNAKKV